MFIRQMKMRLHTAGLVYERVGGKYPKINEKVNVDLGTTSLYYGILAW